MFEKIRKNSRHESNARAIFQIEGKIEHIDEMSRCSISGVVDESRFMDAQLKAVRWFLPASCFGKDKDPCLLAVVVSEQNP